MWDGKVIIEAKSDYGIRISYENGRVYDFVKIVEKVANGDFLILIKSIRNSSKIVVKIETDKDFIVRFN